MLMTKEDYILTQISAERLTYKTLNLAGKKLQVPPVKDMYKRYADLYDKVELLAVEAEQEKQGD